MITALADFTRTRTDSYFLLIDKLDEPWVDESVKFQLIHALFEAIKYFKRLTNFKVVVALRNDLYERMVLESTASKSQLEKYDDYIIRVKWTKEQLKELMDKRLNHLFKWKYSADNVTFDQIYGAKVDGKISTWNYLVERTLNRPRDVINFVNATLQASEGKSSVSKSDFISGEFEYSALRLLSLKHEWGSTYPGISVLLDFLKSRPPYFAAAEICTSDLTTSIYEKMGATDEMQKDPLWERLNRELNGSRDINILDYVKLVLHRLHLVGAIGLKTTNATAWQWIGNGGKPVQPHTIDVDTKVDVTSRMITYTLVALRFSWQDRF